MRSLPASADVVVVGGGILGVATARALALAGMKPLLLEARAFGGAVSGASLAAIGTHMHGLEEYPLLKHAGQLWSDLADALGNPFEYNRQGKLCYILHDEDMAVGQSWVTRERALGADVALLSPQEAREREPLMTGPLIGATWAPDTATVNPFLGLRSVLGLAREAGAVTQANTPVTGLKLQGGRVTGVETSQGQISTPHVVLTGGPWTARLAAMAEITLPIRPRQAQCLASMRQPNGTIRRVISACERAVGVDTGYTQIQQAASGQVLFNTVTAPYDPPEGAQNHIHEVPHGFVLESIDTLLMLFPTLAREPLLRSWVRFEGLTPDSRFLAGSLPPAGLHIAAGDNGSGYCRALMLADYLAELVTGAGGLPRELGARAAQLYAPMRFSGRDAA